MGIGAMKRVSAVLLFLSIFLAGCTAPGEESDDPSADTSGSGGPTIGCSSFGMPGDPVFAPGCHVPLGDHDLVVDSEVRVEGVPANSTGLYILFHVGAGAGRATVAIDAGNFSWQYRFDGHTALTSKFDNGAGPNDDLTWFYAELGSVCQISEFSVRADFVGQYTTLRIEPYALDPGVWNPDATCNGFWSGNSTTPLP